MSRYHSHINSSLKILQGYNGNIPFSIHIKQFFAKEKKYGSKDRKQITAICYNWFRMGLAFQKQLTEENLITSWFLVAKEKSALIESLRPAWFNMMEQSFVDKARFLYLAISTANLFPFSNEINDPANTDAFYNSFLEQPYLFVRIRPAQQQAVIEKIKAAGIDYRLLNHNNTLQLAPGTKIDSLLQIDQEVVIQDYNSQQVLCYLEQNHLFPATKELSAWDCCAASGGKSILLYDVMNGNIHLTVSDIRQSIIANLQQRFKHAGIKKYHHFIADVSIVNNDPNRLPTEKYDLIICDAPCTGSGTWSRTPEQLYFFEPAAIDVFAHKQKKIAANVLPYLKKSGLFFYITCSVFKKENEEVAEFISKQNGIKLVEMKNLYGYEIKADSMFVAVFRKYQ